MTEPAAWVRALDDKERKAVVNKCNQARKLLAELGIDVPPDPTGHIAAIARARAACTTPPARLKKAEVLGFLWMHTVDASTSWKWMAWAWASGARMMLFNQDRSRCVDGVQLIRIGPTRTHGLGDDYIEEIFRALPALDADTFKRLVGCGIVKGAAHLPQHPR